MATYPISFPWRAPKRRGLHLDWKSKRTRTILIGTLLIVLAVSAIAAAALAIMVARLRPTIPTMAQIASYKPVEATKIYTSDGILLAKLQIENRKVVPLNQISRHLVDATLAMEDARFYDHGGIDARGIVRSAWANLTGGDSTGQGGSTITQQLARNVTEFGISRRKTIKRKLREAMTAVRIEQALTKDEILELYLNQIYYGSGAYGAETAARTYFGKPSSKLTLAEAALLAGIPQRPAKYSPFGNMQSATRRRDIVLNRMRETGRIDQTKYEQARREPIQLAKLSTKNRIYRAPYFVDWIVRELTEMYGRDALYSGLTVVTSLNWKMQNTAENVMRARLGYGATQGALVSIDPHNGHVRAMVGGRDYKQNQFNAAADGLRQPGSAFKPIVYAAAFDAGLVDVTTRVRDEKLQLALDERKTWTVRNYGGGYADKERTVLDAIRFSINTIAVDIGMQTGLDRIIQYARAMGINSELPAWPSLTLGAGSVRPIELCSAYGIFAAQGARFEPTGILEVKDARGQIVLKDQPTLRYVRPFLSQATLDQMNFALHEVVQTGSGRPAAVVSNAFGKTGTTSDHRDAWFVGYTPDLVTAVWTAAPAKQANGKIQFKIMHGATGGRLAAPLWARFMTVAAPLQKQINQKHGKRFNITLLKYEMKPIEAEQQEEEQSQAEIAQLYAAELTVQSETYAQHWTPTPPAVNTGDVVYAPQDAFRAVSASPTASSSPPREERAEVAVCADTGNLAGPSCALTVIRRMSPAAEARLDACRGHRARAENSGADAPRFDRFGEQLPE